MSSAITKFKTTPFSKKRLVTLKAMIKGRNLEAQSVLRKRINGSTGIARHEAQNRKKAFANLTRKYLLAYAFLRGIPYKSIETKTNTVLYHYDLAYIVKLCHFVIDNDWMIGKYSGKELEVHHLKAWIKGDPCEYFCKPTPTTEPEKK